MKILHIADFGKEINNGIAEVVINLAEAQTELGHCAKMILLRTPLEYSNVIVTSSYSRIVKSITDFLPDIVVFHSFYKLQYPFIGKFLKRSKIPYLIEMHGGSSCENAKKSKFKKKVANILLFSEFVKESAFIIYLNQVERELSIFKHSSIIIPNGTNLNVNEIVSASDRNDDRTIFLFLGRIDFYHKGLDFLIDAIKQIATTPLKNQVVFKIYGHRYDDTIIDIANQSDGLIEYHDPVFGKEKEAVINASDIFILTSRFEGMPMSVLEALSYGKPCLITPQTNLADLITENDAGWVCELSIEEIARTIQIAYESYNISKALLTEKARQSIKEYGWKEIANKSIVEYSKVLNSK